MPSNMPGAGVRPMLTFRRTAIFAGFVTVLLLAPCKAHAAQTNALDTLKASYQAAMLIIDQTRTQCEGDALTHYGKDLEATLDALKQRGDLETYLVVDTERKRLKAEGKVPEATNSVPALAAAVHQYRTAVALAGVDRNRQTVGLLRKYVAALDGLVARLMQADKIEAAKDVKVERDRAAFELADLESKMPQGVKPAFVAATPAVKMLIPKDAKAFKGHHYLCVLEHQSWHSAESACEKMGGHLAIITSRAEDDFVKKLAAPFMARNDVLFIGCTDEKKEGDWRWVDGSKVQYRGWSAGQPDNDLNNENYGTLWNRGGWNDAPQEDAVITGYVCEWDY